MNATKKITKKDSYNAIAAILKAADNEGITLDMDGITYDSLIEFVEHEVELLDNKAVAAKARAAAKKAEGDALREKIYNLLTDDVQTIAEITNALGDPDVSTQMVTARLTQLCSESVNLAVKETVSVPSADGSKTKKLSGYKRA